jgi:hypothetical protein
MRPERFSFSFFFIIFQSHFQKEFESFCVLVKTTHHSKPYALA